MYIWLFVCVKKDYVFGAKMFAELKARIALRLKALREFRSSKVHN